jgi:hypothetical protein
MASSKYDPLKQTQQAIEEEENARLAALAAKEQERRNADAHGYAELKDSHDRVAKRSQAGDDFGPNVAAVTDVIQGQAAEAHLPPHQVEQEWSVAGVHAVQHNEYQSPARGNMQFAPGGTSFSMATSPPQINERDRENPEVALTGLGTDPNFEITDARAELSGREDAKEMTEQKVERQRFKINLTEEQKQELDAMSAGLTHDRGRGGR